MYPGYPELEQSNATLQAMQLIMQGMLATGHPSGASRCHSGAERDAEGGDEGGSPSGASRFEESSHSSGTPAPVSSADEAHRAEVDEWVANGTF